MGSRMGKVVALARPGQPIEAAQAALWLASDAASYVSGALMCIDGGFALFR